MDSASARIVAAACRLVDCRAEVKRAREAWRRSAMAAHESHGRPPLEEGGGFVAAQETERCWKRGVEDPYGELHRMPVADYCDACKAMAAKRAERIRVGHEHGNALRELAYAVRAQRKFAESEGA
jgi:hypothetical protein